MLSIAVKIDTVTINYADVIPTAKVLLNCQTQECHMYGQKGEVIVNMSDHQEDSVVDLDPSLHKRKESNL